MIETFLGVTVLVCLGYLLLTNLSYVALVLVAFVENGVRRHEGASQDFDAPGESRLTTPPSALRAGGQRGRRDRLDGRIAPRPRVSRVRGDRGERRIVRRDARAPRRGIRARALRGVRPARLPDRERARDL